MLTTATTHVTLGDRLAADLHRVKLRRPRPRPRAKRPARRKAKPGFERLKAALLKVPGVAAVLDDADRLFKGQLAAELAEYRVDVCESKLRQLCEDKLRAYQSHCAATTAAEQFRWYDEGERLNLQILETEASVRQARALLAEARHRCEETEIYCDAGGAR